MEVLIFYAVFREKLSNSEKSGTVSIIKLESERLKTQYTLGELIFTNFTDSN